MDETSPSRAPEEGSTTKAVKDKTCPYCHQAFTSSSLGRHLDLYIRAKNPKAPDGVHDVDAIRKLRQNITRRQPKGAAARRATSASVGTAATETQHSPASSSGDAESSATKSPRAAKAAAAVASKYPIKFRWEATGVINDLATREAEAGRDQQEGDGGRGQKPGLSQRSVSRQTQKQQLDLRQQMQDAQDSARAAELALRELLSSWRAAKQQIGIDSMPFDFDPFSLDFPALTLQCLEPPPTLFASTQHPTPTSWSILPPNHSQLEALHMYFQEEFRRWKIACAAATTVVTEELTYPPSLTAGKTDTKAEVRRAELSAEKMEKHVYDHLEATYAIWNGLAPEQRDQLWRLELARGVGRKQKEVNHLKEGHQVLRQDNTNLRTQIEQLTRLQQPREFKIAPPSTLYVDEKLLRRMLEEGIAGEKHHVGFNIADRHSDLSTVVSSVIDRWKKVIVSTRSASGGLRTQRSFDAGAPSPGDSMGGVSPAAQEPVIQRPPPPPGHHKPPSISKHPPTTTINTTTTTRSYPASDASTTIAVTPAIHSTAPSITAPPDDDEDNDISMSDNNDDEGDGQSSGGEDADPDPDGDADGDTDEDADGEVDDADAEGDEDADGDADMVDDPGEYSGQLHPPEPQHLGVGMGAQGMGRLEVGRTRGHNWAAV